MSQAQDVVDPEKDLRRRHDVEPRHHHPIPSLGQLHHAKYRCNVTPFAGRLGGQQTVILDRDDEKNRQILKEAPDAAPYMTFKEQYDLRPFQALGLWKAAAIEGMGKASMCRKALESFAERLPYS